MNSRSRSYAASPAVSCGASLSKPLSKPLSKSLPKSVSMSSRKPASRALSKPSSRSAPGSAQASSPNGGLTEYTVSESAVSQASPPRGSDSSAGDPSRGASMRGTPAGPVGIGRSSAGISNPVPARSVNEPPAAPPPRSDPAPEFGGEDTPVSDSWGGSPVCEAPSLSSSTWSSQSLPRRSSSASASTVVRGLVSVGFGGESSRGVKSTGRPATVTRARGALASWPRLP